MSDIRNIFNIGQSALQSSKTAIEVTAQNIANVDTPGYTKKEVILAARAVATGSPLFLNGVEVEEIKRSCDENLSQQITQQEGKTAYWQTKKEYLGAIEEIFNEAGGLGLNNDLNKFRDAWQNLSLDPNGYEEREEVISSANQMIGTFNSKSQDFQEIMENVREEMDHLLEESNEILRKIAELNKKIGENLGGQVNEYKDELDKLVEDLSRVTNINYWSEENGQATVSVNGHPLVEGSSYFTLTSVSDEQGQMAIQKRLPDGTLINITDRLTSGELKSVLDLNNEIMPEYDEQLDKIAFTLSEKMNEAHRTGYGLQGATNIDFFVPLNNQAGAAQNLALNPEIINDADLIASSSSPDILNNENALKIIELQQNPTIQKGGSFINLHDYHGLMQSEIGLASQGAQKNFDQQQMILQNLKDKRSLISDVSLDEELANLIRFQQTYNASAKIISTADEMMTTILDLKA